MLCYEDEGIEGGAAAWIDFFILVVEGHELGELAHNRERSGM